MLFKVDENLPVEIAVMLRNAAHDALTVNDENLAGYPDLKIADVCRNEGRVLVTLDTDFANIYAYPPSDFSGIVVLRLARQDKPHILAVFQSVVSALRTESLDNRLWIVEETGIRVRQ